MKKLIIALLFAASSFAGAQAQILWRVSGHDAKADSYLLGTHHLAPLSMLDSIAGFNAALNEVECVAGEIDMADMNANAQSLMGYMMAPADSMLTAVLLPEQVDSLTLVLQKYMGPQMTAQQMNPLKPAAVATQLALLETMATMPEAAQALAAGQQLDSEVQARAKAASKPVLAFETAAEQMEILMGSPIAAQADMLMEAVRQDLDGRAVESARKLADAYLSQDLDAIARQMFSEDEMAAEDVERLIFDRNHKWIGRLVETLPAKSVLVAVGAGHLPGEHGLIELLRKQGYNVEPVK